MANVHTFDAHHKVDLLIVPAAQGSLNSSWVQPFADGGSSDRAVFMMVVGAVSANQNFKLTQALTSGGGTPKDITGAAITAITTSTDECVVTIEIAPGALDNLNGYTWVRAEVSVAGGTPVWGLLMLKHRLRYPGVGGQPTAYRQAVIVI